MLFMVMSMHVVVVEYIKQQPNTERFANVDERPHIVTWGDACGENRLIASVVVHSGRMWWTVWYAPEELVEEFLPRKDGEIQLLEMLAIAFTLGTFEAVLKGALWTNFTDSDAVLGTMLSGAAGVSSADMTNYIGRLWLHCSSLDIGLQLYRVPSKANISDGPFRRDLSVLEKFGAAYVPPVLPSWVADVWQKLDFSSGDSCVPSWVNQSPG